MRLHDYLLNNNVSDLAMKIGTSPMYLRQIGWGKATPSMRLAKLIVTATDGQVTFDDLAASLDGAGPGAGRDQG